jgi:tetratricopeptide (TPR) repeat protein
MARMSGRFGLSRFEADEYYQLALDAYKKGRYDVAINNLNDAIALMPNRAELYAARGFIFLEDGVKDKAQADFQQALKIFPLEMLAHYGRGMIAYNDKNWDEAIAHLTDAYKSDPKRPETLYYLALAYHRKGTHEIAHRIMDNAVAAFPESDKRRGDATRWIKEFDKILGTKESPALAPSNNPTPKQLL